jgi:hypothetical protein
MRFPNVNLRVWHDLFFSFFSLEEFLLIVQDSLSNDTCSEFFAYPFVYQNMLFLVIYLPFFLIEHVDCITLPCHYKNASLKLGIPTLNPSI